MVAVVEWVLSIKGVAVCLERTAHPLRIVIMQYHFSSSEPKNDSPSIANLKHIAALPRASLQSAIKMF
jgi:hypothetical protein